MTESKANREYRKKREAREQRKRMLEQELARRETIDNIAERECFPQQLDFIMDPSKRKGLITPRRSGKSTVFAVWLIQEALKYPGRKQLYLGLTSESAESIIWTGEKMMRDMLEKYGIEFEYNQLKKIIKFSNGSTIRLMGVDQSPGQMRKLKGGKYHMVIQDEMQDIEQDTKELLEEVLPQAVTDYMLDGGGIIACGGTPGTKMGENYWWLMTKQLPDGSPDKRLPGWTVRSWTVSDNPYMREEYAAMCDELLKAKGPTYMEDSGFKRQWLGRWVFESNNMVYKFEEKRNIINNNPEGVGFHANQTLINKLLSGSGEFVYRFGVDLGWEDAWALVVGAYHPHAKHFYIVECFKRNHVVYDDIGATLVAYHSKYRPVNIIVDTGGGGKLVSESMRIKFALPIIGADKKAGKQDTVARMNSDFLSGAIQVVPGEANKELVKEWQELLLDMKSLRNGIWKEVQTKDNHLADSALYCYRDAVHYLGVPQEIKREPDMADRLIAKMKQKTKANPWRQSPFDQAEEKQKAQWLLADILKGKT